jgi:hypothetical protein
MFLFQSLTTRSPRTGCRADGIRPRSRCQCLFHSPPAALRQGVAQTVFDHVVNDNVYSNHSPPAALRKGVARTVFDLVVNVMFNPNTHYPGPSDRVSRGQYSTSCKVMKSSLHLPPAALRQSVARAVFDLVRSHEVFFFTLTTRGPQTGCRADSI